MTSRAPGILPSVAVASKDNRHEHAEEQVRQIAPIVHFRLQIQARTYVCKIIFQNTCCSVFLLSPRVTECQGGPMPKAVTWDRIEDSPFFADSRTCAESINLGTFLVYTDGWGSSLATSQHRAVASMTLWTRTHCAQPSAKDSWPKIKTSSRAWLFCPETWLSPWPHAVPLSLTRRLRSSIFDRISIPPSLLVGHEA